MKLHLLVIHPATTGPLAELRDGFLDRARKLAKQRGISDIQLHAVKSGGGKSAEAGRLEKQLEKLGSSFVIGLDEVGKHQKSVDFAKMIARQGDNPAVQNLVFVVGGAEGFCQTLKPQFDSLLSFGQMTWPHQLVHVMLAEQVYRGLSILAGAPYHKV